MHHDTTTRTTKVEVNACCCMGGSGWCKFKFFKSSTADKVGPEQPATEAVAVQSDSKLEQGA